jgi:hypothetical protein
VFLLLCRFSAGQVNLDGLRRLDGGLPGPALKTGLLATVRSLAGR